MQIILKSRRTCPINVGADVQCDGANHVNWRVAICIAKCNAASNANCQYWYYTGCNAAGIATCVAKVQVVERSLQGLQVHIEHMA